MAFAAALLQLLLLTQWEGQKARDIGTIPGADGKTGDEDGDGEDDNLQPLRNSQLRQGQINMDKRKLRELVEKIRRGEKLSPKDQESLPPQLQNLQDEVRLKAEERLAREAALRDPVEASEQKQLAAEEKAQTERKRAAELKAISEAAAQAAAQRADAEAMARATARRQEEAAQALALDLEKAQTRRNQNLAIGGGLAAIAAVIGGIVFLKRRR